jgi:hypothetical protein
MSEAGMMLSRLASGTSQGGRLYAFLPSFESSKIRLL